ncbi:hypothetical protein AX14_009591 [Amanita brunnescens Koide BX004]|nr:hypothetical protein AX14_009591 [Amanita brunnescens Koide BX004]
MEALTHCTVMHISTAPADTFPSYLQDPSSEASKACKAVDVLGDDLQLPLIDRYVAMELKDYHQGLSDGRSRTAWRLTALCMVSKRTNLSKIKSSLGNGGRAGFPC